MGMRFTEEQKWKDRWFCSLSIQHRYFWLYLCDNCDKAGVWDEPPGLAEFNMGYKQGEFDFHSALKAFGERIKVLKEGAWWLVKFIDFQNPNGLTNANYHKPIWKSIERYNIPYSTHDQPMTNPWSRVQDMDIDKDKDKGMDKDNQLKASFEQFYTAYPRKTARRAAEKAWERIKPDSMLLQKILKALAVQKTNWKDPKFIPHPATWLNGNRWEDEIFVKKTNELSGLA